ncbi:MAG: tyrosine--tRNA ligase [Deltaproteobacteria bacterium]|nr:tyrosine--tRNA ligase [Deltaproteobacteria bacterium]
MTSDIAAEVDRQIEVMREGASAFYGEKELRVSLAASLGSGKPLRVKLGMDPSSPDLHLGHTVVLRKLKRIQELGHTPIFLIGDFTARIGDPSGKKKTRPALDADEVKANADTYVEQVGKVLDVSRAEVRFNSEWMESLTSSDLVRLCSHYTVARLLERDDFAKRYKEGDAIAVHEFLYPFVQSYDSVALEADIELGGTDQTFNLLMGREIQRDYGQAPQAVITHTLLVGTDGVDKMSKSLGNTIGISDPPEDVYGKIMSISDTLMLEYCDVLRDDSAAWVRLASERARLGEGAGDPLAFKNALARGVVERFHGVEAADRAAAHFASVIGRKEVPDDLPVTDVDLGGSDIGLLDLLRRLGLTRSNGEGRRLVEQRGVRLDGELALDPALRISPGSYLLKVGKRRFARVQLK